MFFVFLYNRFYLLLLGGVAGLPCPHFLFVGKHDFITDLNLEKVRVYRYNLGAFSEIHSYKHWFMANIVKYRLQLCR